jgi:hypothetical protein
VFIPSDAPYARTALLRAARDGKSVVLIFPDGEERILSALPRWRVAQVSALARFDEFTGEVVVRMSRIVRDLLRRDRTFH